VEFSSKAISDLQMIKKLNIEHLPVCIAKTQKSFSEDEKAYGTPRNFKITVKEIEIATGAGFVIPIIGNMVRMPGLPLKPASENMSIDKNGIINGLS
jgi:formate--tetrahydrofolate ligase